MGLSVLVVDDHKDLVLSTVALLRTAGHEAEGCSSGEEALAFIDEHDPDVVLVDLAMPGMSGWSLAQHVRSKRSGRPVLIALTGQFKGAADLMLSRMNGFDHYVLKPADPDKLLALIEGRPA